MPLHLLVFITFSFPLVIGVTIQDLYPYSNWTEIERDHIQVFAMRSYLYWSNNDNKEINVMKAGTVRLSGTNAKNSLDILAYSVETPKRPPRIYVDSLQSPKDLERAKNEIRAAMPESSTFVPLELTVLTWLEVEFFVRLRTTFQIVLATNNTNTILILKYVEMNYPNVKLAFYPKVQLRYSHGDGTKFDYVRFVRGSGTADIRENVVKGSNSGIPGRWIIDLSANPSGQKSYPTDPIAPQSSYTSYGSVVIRGIMTLANITWKGKFMTDSNVASLLENPSSPDAAEMKSTISDWLFSFYRTKVMFSPGVIEIYNLVLRTGSLVADHTLEARNASNLCGTAKCTNSSLASIKQRGDTALASDGNIVRTGDLTAKVIKNEVSSYEECPPSPKRFCDANADCLYVESILEPACHCKSGYAGNGLDGNCKKIEATRSDTNAIIGGVAGAVAFLFVCIIVVIVYFTRRRRQTEQLLKTATVVGKDVVNELNNGETTDLRSRSKRKKLKASSLMRHSDLDFDLYQAQ